jgi:hypothetical protein
MEVRDVLLAVALKYILDARISRLLFGAAKPNDIIYIYPFIGKTDDIYLVLS